MKTQSWTKNKAQWKQKWQTEQIELITDAESATDFVKRIDEFEHIGTSKVMAAKILAEHTKGLKLVFNKETKSYEKV